MKFLLAIISLTLATLVTGAPMTNFLSHDLSVCNNGGEETHGIYTVDDTAELSMCGNHLSFGSLDQTTNIDLTQYTCGDYMFSLRNVQLSSAISMTIKIGSTRYVAVGKGSPPVPPGTKSLNAYAEWTFGSCEGVMPTTQAVFVGSLADYNKFKDLANDFGAYPIGVQDGNVFSDGLQCIRVENPACSH